MKMKNLSFLILIGQLALGCKVDAGDDNRSGKAGSNPSKLDAGDDNRSGKAASTPSKLDSGDDNRSGKAASNPSGQRIDLSGSGATADKPNIVFFISDDHTLHDTGAYGNQQVMTPNIDKLASEGMTFNNVYAASAMCAPSRSALYTGMYPYRNGNNRNHGSIKKNVKSVAHYLKDLGYRVALAGKTHIKPKKQFQFKYLEVKAWAKIENFMTKKPDQPFVLFYASHNPHSPHLRKGPFKGKEDKIITPPHQLDTAATRKKISRYYNDIYAMDREMGKLRDLVQQADLKPKTAFFYAADHGYSLFAKWTLYDAGVRVPFMVSWPEMVKAGSKNDGLVSFVDVLPTMVEMVGGPPPAAPATIDGKSFLPLLMGSDNEHHDYVFATHTNKGIINGKAFPSRAIRSKQYKLILNPCKGCINQNTQTHDGGPKNKGVFKSWLELARIDAFAWDRVNLWLSRPEIELYDIQNDPNELENLADREDMQTIKQDLNGRLLAWMQQQQDRALDFNWDKKNHKPWVKLPPRPE